MAFAKKSDLAKHSQVPGKVSRKRQAPLDGVVARSNQFHRNAVDQSPHRLKKKHSTKQTEKKVGPQSLRPQKRVRSGPSDEALKLSEKLKELSRIKNLDEGLRIYNDPTNKNVVDGHHLCIIIDCCARCGKVWEAEKMLKELETSGTRVNVETKTALMKGYAHSGQIGKAETLFVEMCNSKSRTDKPNVRTLNTLLRGCLWSAASVNSEGCVTGGLVTAEKAWNMCRSINEVDPKVIVFDISSFEYFITLLCQALRAEDAKSQIDEMKMFFRVPTSASDIPPSVCETLALANLSLARAYAILGATKDAEIACREFTVFSQSMKANLMNGGASEESNHQSRLTTKQGKDTKGSRRVESNALFRSHRMNEAEKEARVILDLCQSDGLVKDPRQLARRLVTRLQVLAGGGSTTADGAPNLSINESHCTRSIQEQFLNTLYFSFGLERILRDASVPLKESTAFLKKKDCNRILGSIGLQGGIVLDDEVLDIQRIFRVGIGENKQKQPRRHSLEIELGSGFGDWIVRKARDDPKTNFLSVELRSDRVGQTFARTAMLAGTTPIDNLCIVGAESSSFLSGQIPDDSVSAIYINHPEPPTQTFGSDSNLLDAIAKGGTEPAHMVSSHLMRVAARCLSADKQGRLIIVTDNKWYGRLLCATLAKTMALDHSLLMPVQLEQPFVAVESISTSNGTVTLFEGKPDESIGHPLAIEADAKEGTTYFDRLWKTGAGLHAEKSLRFILVACRSPLRS